MNADRVTIVHPGGEDPRPNLALAPRLATLSGVRIALIDNAKHMEHVGAQRKPGTRGTYEMIWRNHHPGQRRRP